MLRAISLVLLPFSLLVACGDKADDETGDPPGDEGSGDEGGGDEGSGDDGGGPVDADGDGFDEDSDCDDADADVNPDAAEVCDEVDNDCDGDIDEDVTETYFADTDGDGFGDVDQPLALCGAMEGYVPNASDCDDSEATTFPGADELSCDNVDNDCDEEVDEDSAFVPSVYATLQEAVDALPDGAEICVEPGTYTEQLDLSGRTLAITGLAGPGSTFLDVGSSAPMITIAGESETFGAGDIAISGFTVTSGELRTDGADVLGGFAYVDGGTLSLSELEVTAMSGEQVGKQVLEGLLVYALDSSLSLQDIVVTQASLSLTGDANSSIYGITGGLVRTVRGELDLDSMSVSGLSITSEESRDTCYVFGAVLAMDDNGLMNSASNSMEGTAFSIADLEIRDSTTEVHCVDRASTGALLHLTNVSGELVGLEVTGTVAEASSDRVAGVSSLVYGWQLGGEVDLSVLDISDNALGQESSNSSTSYLVYLDGAEVSYLTAWNNRIGNAEGQYVGGLVELESGFVSHADLRGNELTSGGYASSLLVVYASEADAGLSNFVLAGNKVEAHSLYGTALQVEAELGDATVRNGDLVGNHFAGAFGSSGVALITGGIDEDDVVVDLSNLQLVNNTYDGEGNGDGELLAVVPWDEEGFSLRYSNLFGNSSDQTSWGDPTGVDGNISADPLYTDVSGADPTAWDLSLQAGSPALDAGDPDVTDDDGSPSDMGAYGGPDGTAW